MRSLIFVLTLLSQTCFGQDTPDTLRILAQQIEAGEGSKIHIAKYKVLKVLEGELNVPSISVGYTGYEDLLYPKQIQGSRTSHFSNFLYRNSFNFRQFLRNQLDVSAFIALATIRCWSQIWCIGF